MTEQTTTYSGEDEQAELMEAIEQGRRHKIAAEIMNEIIEVRREEIVRDFETGAVTGSNALDAISELRVIKRFRDITRKMVQLGEIAEERMNEIGG